MPNSNLPTSQPPLPEPPLSTAHSSISPIVDTDYRIRAADLEGATRRVEVANVTFQGVEAMTPVLHLVGQSKRLVMTPEHVAQMVEITGTVLMERWVGTVILLHPRTQKHSSHIEIKPVTRRGRGRPMPVYVSEDKRGWILAFSVVSLLLCISVIVVLLNFQMILTTVQELLELWPLR